MIHSCCAVAWKSRQLSMKAHLVPPPVPPAGIESRLISVSQWPIWEAGSAGHKTDLMYQFRVQSHKGPWAYATCLPNSTSTEWHPCLGASTVGLILSVALVQGH